MKPLTKLTVEEAAQFIEHGETIGVSGFTAAGAPKAVPRRHCRQGRS